MPTLQDIADELDVSVSLVSKVLNKRLGSTRVNDDLADRIRQSADRLGYRKNRSALALLAGRQDVIGVFVHRHGQAGSGLIEAFLDGVSTAMKSVETSKKQFIWFYSDHEEFTERRRELHPGMVDGLIVAGVHHDWLKQDLLAVQAGRVPVVTVFNESLDPSIRNVAVTEEDLMAMATAHLIERGCRRILHIDSIAGRTAGYRRALAEAGIAFDEQLIFHDPDGRQFAPDGGAAVVRQAVERGIAFDGFAAPSDGQAACAINEMTARGIKVPQQVKVVGVDAAPFGQLCIVPITSVSQRDFERGQLAVRLVSALIDGKPAESIKIDPTLIPAASTGD